jgi:subtilase family serine protease
MMRLRERRAALAPLVQAVGLVLTVAAMTTLILVLLVGGGGGAHGRGGADSRATREVAAGRSHQAVGYTPRQLQVAYGILPLLARGIDGRKRTVVVVEPAVRSGSSTAFGEAVTDIRLDLAAFDRRYGLPPAELTVSSSTRLSPAAHSLANYEEVLDVEMVHAVAPQAAIRVVLTQPENYWSGSSLIGSLRSMLRDRDPGDVISFSYTIPELCLRSTRPHGASELESVHALLHAAVLRHITVVANSGDYGPLVPSCGGDEQTPYAGVSMPASDSVVTAVGGTSLVLEPPTGTYRREAAWNQPPSTPSPLLVGRGWAGSYASGGGYSRIYNQPAFHQGPTTSYDSPFRPRALPDVAADADSRHGMEVVTVQGGRLEYTIAGGTSASAPLWAGIIALADQNGRRRLGYINAALYRIGRSPSYHYAFHDITSGSNTVQFGTASSIVQGYRAKRGWDAVTGWGSPDAANLVPLLGRAVQATDGAGLFGF